jgi:CO dehydrogenase maturation factor
MAKTIIVTGRGGTGKSTFAALGSRFLPSPKLLVDADPDQSLGQLLGVPPGDGGTRTVSEILHDIQKGELEGGIDSLPLSEQVEYLLHYDCLEETAEFDLITLGVKWTPGCYCAPNNILRNIIPEIASGYQYAILDSPAGLEHLNRRVLKRANDVFAIMDPSAKSIRNARTVREFAQEIGFQFDNLYLVANHSFGDRDLERLEAVDGTTLLGRVEADHTVQEADWEGRSLLQIPADSPACTSIRAILQAAGYDVTCDAPAPSS